MLLPLLTVIVYLQISTYPHLHLLKKSIEGESKIKRRRMFEVSYSFGQFPLHDFQGIIRHEPI
jgi:hypothetical protein